MSRLLLFLCIALGLLGGDDAAKRSNTEFRAAAHGLHFVNSFKGVPLPAPLRNSPLKALIGDKLPEQFGLCGGMSSTAADYFYAKMDVPQATKAPAEGSKFYEYLYLRQSESFGVGIKMVTQFAQWMRLPDKGDGGTWALTRPEVRKIETELKDGKLVLLGLVYRKATKEVESPAPVGKMWENHQVLAYGLKEADGATEFRIYDPNFPDDAEVVIRIKGMSGAAETPIDEKAVSIERVTGAGKTARVRGFFEMPYTPRVPPAGL